MPSELKIPPLGESITEVEIGEWHKAENDTVTSGEELVTIESEKASLELPAPAGGRLTKIVKHKGDVVKIGETIAMIGEAEGPLPANGDKKDGEKKEAPTKQETTPAAPKPTARTEATKETKRTGGTEEETPNATEADAPKTEVREAKEPDGEEGKAKPGSKTPAAPPAAAEEEIVPMSPLRKTAARRLVEAGQNAALLTTFNEADMSAVMAMRKEYGAAFVEKYQSKLGFMSFFVKAAVAALREVPQINAEVRGTDIVYRNYFDIGIAISSGRGLVVPVLRRAERMSFAEIEQAISDFARRADTGSLKPDELTGGTFTITNGGVFGSLLSTPIVNPPQSGVLGMHTIQERPVARQGQVVIRPMMYLALTYDHRIVDGKQAVTFLKRIKEAIETPARMLIEV